MTQEEKAKAYDKALNWMRELYPGLHGATKEDAEHYFPELRESEDERMMREFNDWLCEEVECRTNDLRDEEDRRTLNMLCYILPKVKDWLDEQKEQKPISSCDIVPYIDEKFAALQDMWREEKVYFDWDDMKDMIEDVARHFYHKEQKPSTGIYWHAIKKGEKLPCRAYIWNPNYEKYHDCWEGKLIPNIENVRVGADTWYLPAKDVRDLPREGVDELPEEQKPAEWSEEDEDFINMLILHFNYLIDKGGDSVETYKSYREKLKSLRPSWKPNEQEKGALRTAIHILTEERNFPKAAAQLQNILDAFEGKESRKDFKPNKEQMEALKWLVEYVSTSERHIVVIANLYEQLKKL